MRTKILSLWLLLLAGTATGFAEIIDSGITGNCTWVLSDDGTITIGGTGTMSDHENGEPPWLRYSASITAAVIEDGVTSIGNGAFEDCIRLASVTLPDGITSIGMEAFEGCIALVSVTLPSQLKYIGEEAFEGCTGLVSVTFPDGLKKIEGNAFAGCTRLVSVTLPAGLIKVEDRSFEGCTGLVSVTLPAGLTEIEDEAFSGCTGLVSVLSLTPTPLNIDTETFEDVDLSRITLYVPTGSVETYKAAPVWNLFKTVLPYVSSAIESPASGSATSVYPNPVTESFYINGITAPTQVTVTDLSGRTVLTQTVAGNEPVAAGHLPKGVYLVNVNGKTVKVVKK
jgi:hypothetical protein